VKPQVCPRCERQIEASEPVVQEVRVELRRVQPGDPLLSYPTRPLRHSHTACWTPQVGWAVITRGKLQDVAAGAS
jgi:hypothetical protein